jgi:hypothetical protein
MRAILEVEQPSESWGTPETEATIERAHELAGALCDELADVTKGMPWSDERHQLSLVWTEALEVLFELGRLARIK